MGINTWVHRLKQTRNYVRGGIHTKSCHEKWHLGVCGWVRFRARRFIRSNLTLFEIPNKSYVFYAFISKNRQEQESKEIFVLFCLTLLFRKIAVLCLLSTFHIFDCAVFRTFLYTTLIVTSEKQLYIKQRRT